MRISKAFPSTYLASHDLDGRDVTMTISEVKEEEVGRKREEKPVIYFEENEKGVVLNKTNAKVLSDLYGDDTDEWVGECITLFEKEVEFAGDMVTAIRMKAPGRKGATNEKAREPREDDEDDEQPRKKGGKRGGGGPSGEIPFAPDR